MNALLLSGLVGSLTYAIYYSSIQYKTKQDIEELETAKKIAQKTSNLKELITIDNLDNSNSIIVDDSSTIVTNNKISHLVVPTNASKYDEEILDKHFRATRTYLKTNYTNSKPDCSQLETTGLITLNQCNYISSKEFNFFTYKNGEIEYEIPKKLSNKVISLTKAEKSDIDANTTSIKENDYFVRSEFMEKKIYDLTSKYNQLISEHINKGNIDYAKELNNKLATFNQREADLNTAKYSW